MDIDRRRDTRPLWLRIHRWISAGLFVLLAPLFAAGALSMLRPTIDAAIHPERRPITLAPDTPPLGAYQAAAAAAFGPGATVTTLILRPGDAVVALGRVRPTLDAHAPRDTGPPVRLTAWIDPGAARLLSMQAQRGRGDGVMDLMSRFHETLMLGRGGRRLVGVLGAVVLIQAATGLALWWPSAAPLWRGPRWRRSDDALTNLYRAVGFWTAIPLAILAATGIGLAFPDMTVRAMGHVAPAPQPQHPAGRTLLASRLNADQAAAIALAGETGAHIARVEQPTDTSPSWKFEVVGSHRSVRIGVDDDTGTVLPLDDRGVGPRTLVQRAIFRLHSGDGDGLAWDIWRWIAIVAGLTPTVLAAASATVFGLRRIRRGRG